MGNKIRHTPLALKKKELTKYKLELARTWSGFGLIPRLHPVSPATASVRRRCSLARSASSDHFRLGDLRESVLFQPAQRAEDRD